MFSSDSFRNLVICELFNTLSAAEMFHDSAEYKFATDIDTVTQASLGQSL